MPREKGMPGGTEMLLLSLLSRKEMYGYEMIATLREQSDHVFDLKAGTLYPLLHGLEREGWVTSRDEAAKNRARRYYAITPAGRAALEEQKARWDAYAAGVRGVLEGGAYCGA
ncbi:helix-turn-helix transcriptional regulator [uncultured Intestinimonas sp.]|uniref:PadR family transcriptional regulator n=1 Tax=uncultured Intestinimonas sp. TaxID=1689265 RepID=UPI0025F0FF2C|nr:helix-turn-helix transcriptional regulator [uncultured Intestinimonas sp.]